MTGVQTCALPIFNGTGKHAILNGGRPAAGKTGTTEEMDFVGCSCDLAEVYYLRP